MVGGKELYLSLGPASSHSGDTSRTGIDGHGCSLLDVVPSPPLGALAGVHSTLLNVAEKVPEQTAA